MQPPTIQYPRSLALSTQTTEKDTLTETQKYPAIEENKTLRANRDFFKIQKNSFKGKCI
jgi:hypothetical protein